tara:strand:+ start:2799 stop:3509 length:711 start_codon:yes stop_codon:yes gene_type:complete
MLESLRNKKILVVVAHPDDEILGIGGTINKLVNNYGCEIKVIILGEGITSRGNDSEKSNQKEDLKLHKANIEKAKSFLGYQQLEYYDLPDNRFDTVPLLDIIKIIESEKLNFKPSIVFTHHGGDLNIDHQKTFEAVITACRPIKEEIVNTVITFETLSSSEWIPSNDKRKFTPNLFISLTENNIKSKINSMESYFFEKREYPHPRSPKAIKLRAEMWGVTVGKKFSEAFEIIRIIQ